MNTSPEREIVNLNKLLHKILGYDRVEIYGKSIWGERILSAGEEETLQLLKGCSDQTLPKVYQILSFYYPRWIAYNAIQQSDDRYKDLSSNNELLIALTSIIDWLANTENKETRWKDRFVCFIEQNLLKSEINHVLDNFNITNKEGIKGMLGKGNLKGLARHIYKIRSRVVHYAELGSLYPYQALFDIDPENEVPILYPMASAQDFRKLLWKAIFHSLDLEIITLPDRALPIKDSDKKHSIFL